jgi:hypothetical protein
MTVLAQPHPYLQERELGNRYFLEIQINGHRISRR